MKKYTKLYMDYFGYVLDDVIPCELCGNRAVDIHHIKARGMGGSKNSDHIDNLMAVCRQCHVDYGDRKDKLDYLISIHERHLKNK